MYTIKSIVLAGVLGLASFAQPQQEEIGHQAEISSYTKSLKGYNLAKPDAVYQLPDILHEVSGLTNISNSILGCVQDEKGTIFVYDLKNQKIVQQYNFHQDGDYEGLTIVGEAMYVLRSDGKLMRIDNYSQPDFKLTVFDDNVPAADNEGLCYDAQNNRLLIASKSNPDNAGKSTRAVYAFNLKTQKLEEKPAVKFDEKEAIKKLSSGSDKNTTFKPSSLGVHPKTQQLYVLSASDAWVAVFNPDGKFVELVQLDRDMFNKPEGITFVSNGDMYIANEGGKGKPTLLKFSYRP